MSYKQKFIRCIVTAARMGDVTKILVAIEGGDSAGTEQLLPLVYDELKRIAEQQLKSERNGHTLQATALVHEAYLRLVDASEAANWQNKRHFLAAASEAMRRLLIDHARRKSAQKRGGGWQRQAICENSLFSLEAPERLIDFDDALQKLDRQEPLAAELIKLHVYGGVSIEDASEILAVARASGYRLWTYGRAWLLAELDG